MPLVKIIQKGWDGYTGEMGTTRFENGIADVTQAECTRIGSIIQIVEINEEGNTIGQLSMSNAITQTKSMSAPVIPPRKRMDQEIAEQEAQDALAEQEMLGENFEMDFDSVDDEILDPTGEDNIDDELGLNDDMSPKIYTREELENIADQSGIKGLRDIGDEYGVKNTAIRGLIDAILTAQTSETH